MIKKGGRDGVVLEPFSVAHRLCKYLPYVKFTLKNGSSFISRPSFSFPFVKPPNMIPNVDETLLFNEFGPSKDHELAPSPAALWIKASDFEVDEKKAKRGHY